MKPKPCCCGCCSLSTATVVAAAICALECTAGLFWNSQLWMHLEGKKSLGIFPCFLKVSSLSDFNVVHGLVLASTILHAIWLVLCAMAVRANIALSRSVLIAWMLCVDLQTCFDVGATVYFAVKLQNVGYKQLTALYTADNEPTQSLAYLTLLVLFSRGVVFWFLNLYLAHVVQLRAKEIEYNNSLLALYILSHLSPRAECNADPVRPRDQPPAYCSPSYLPKYLMPGCRDSLESSWSLNTEALEGITSFQNPMYPRIDQSSVSDLRQLEIHSRPPPYGQVADIEQSYRLVGHGVLPG